MHILLLEPFFTGSHASWAREYQRFSQHTVSILQLPGRHWKWRMHGGAIQLAKQFRDSGILPDLILATDMLDVSTFQALTKVHTHDIPLCLYFHENQLTYPRSARDTDIQQQRDNHYAFINYTSALAADQVYFNSHFHRQTFFTALADMLRALPDYQDRHLVEEIQQKSSVLPLGMDLHQLEAYKPDPVPRNKPKLILWNHRWEHDKNPESFFKVLIQLKDHDIPFELAVLGESYKRQPSIFEEARLRLSDRIVHWGYADAKTYREWLWRADILPVTSHHDFFGRSVVEAIYCGTVPLLPNRLAYPEHIPEADHPGYLYSTDDDLYNRLVNWLKTGSIPQTDSLRKHIWRYDWQYLANYYDESFEEITSHQQG